MNELLLQWHSRFNNSLSLTVSQNINNFFLKGSEKDHLHDEIMFNLFLLNNTLLPVQTKNTVEVKHMEN